MTSLKIAIFLLVVLGGTTTYVFLSRVIIPIFQLYLENKQLK